MARLISPNGVEVNASELDTPILLAAGYKPAVEAEEPKKTAKKKAARKKE